MQNKKKLVYGVGINDAEYTVQKRNKDGKMERCPYYVKWSSMMQRSYSEQYNKKFGSYKDVEVCESWKTFSNFKKWMETKDWKDKELDKDIMITNNKIYSPSACIFIPKTINYLFADSAKARGKYPQGVHIDKKNNKFISQINKYGKRTWIGRFNTIDEAEQAYKISKSSYIIELANKEDISEIIKLRLIELSTKLLE